MSDWAKVFTEGTKHLCLTCGASCDDLKAALTAEKAAREKAEADVAAMVKLYAEKNLSGYRDLASKLCTAEAERDDWKARALSARSEALEEAAKVIDTLAKRTRVPTILDTYNVVAEDIRALAARDEEGTK